MVLTRHNAYVILAKSVRKNIADGEGNSCIRKTDLEDLLAMGYNNDTVYNLWEMLLNEEPVKRSIWKMKDSMHTVKLMY